MKNFDKKQTMALIARLQKAAQEIGKEFGLEVCPVHARSAEYEVRSLVRFYDPKDVKALSKSAVCFIHNAHLLGFQVSDLGRTIQYKGEGYVIEGLTKSHRVICRHCKNKRRSYFNNLLVLSLLC